MSPIRSDASSPGARLVSQAVRDTLGLASASSPAPVGPSDRRRLGGRPIHPAHGVLRIIQRGGIVELEEAGPLPATGISRRRRASQVGLAGTVLDEVPFERLPPNQISAVLQRLDHKLTPKRGLRALVDGALSAPDARPVEQGSILLFVHGTFSNSDNVLAEIAANPWGATFLQLAVAAYDQVLFFDHPTVAVSPFLNARALTLALAGTKAEVDVVCHSRGGLVARWWAEVLDRRPTPGIVFVGSPLAGTSLASPPRLRSAISLLASIGHALGEAGGMAAVAWPFAAVAAELFRIGSTLTSAVAQVPIVDAVVALAPGLSAQSRVGNNSEIVSLRDGAPDPTRYSAVRANFESERVGWQFWKAFRRLPERIADTGADAIFPEKNDLVVDTRSMAELKGGLVLERDAVHDFGTTDVVHHTNYFRQPETLQFVAARLGFSAAPPRKMRRNPG